MLVILLLLLPGLQTQDVTPTNSIEQTTARNFRFQPVKFLKSVKPVKKGPILFPSGPPPAPTPLVVTARPLIDSIRRSDLNPNNTQQASSQVNQVAYTPDYLERSSGYLDRSLDRNSNSISYVDSPTPDYDIRNEPFRGAANDGYEQGSSSRPLLYRGLQDYPSSRQMKALVPTNNPYYDYRDSTPDDTTFYLNKNSYIDPSKYYTQERSNLPPIYRVLSHQANAVLSQQNSLHSTPQPKPIYEYQKPEPENTNYNQGSAEQSTSGHNSGDNYAFSYAVKDRQTGDDFSHSQSSSGSATNGEYRVRLPDGRMQIVSYTADEGGYKAEVRYDDDEQKTNGYNGNTNNGNQENRYVNNHYTVNEPKNINTNNNYDNYNNRNVFDDYVDKSRQTNSVEPNNHFVLNNVYQNQNDGVFETDKITGNNRFSSEAFNFKTLEPKLDDYGLSSGEASTEYKDYSSEAISYQPHQSKYSQYFKPIRSTVVPPYAELKNLFVTQNPHFALVSPTRVQPEAIETATEEVVVIGDKKPNLYTNIRNVLSETSVSSQPLSFTTLPPPVVTPTNFLYSTIANLRNKLNLSVKPILSQAYIDKINKYIDFKF